MKEDSIVTIKNWNWDRDWTRLDFCWISCRSLDSGRSTAPQDYE